MLFTTQRGRKKEINTHKVARGQLSLGVPSGRRNARGGGCLSWGVRPGSRQALNLLKENAESRGTLLPSQDPAVQGPRDSGQLSEARQGSHRGTTKAKSAQRFCALSSPS